MDGGASNLEGASPETAARGRATARVTLVRGRHRWTFECGPSDGAALRRRMADLVSDPGCPLDRFDAAVAAHQLWGFGGAGATGPAEDSTVDADPGTGGEECLS